MAEQSLFFQLEREAFRKGIKARSEEAMEWFRRRVKELGRMNPHDILKDPALERRQRFASGNMYMYWYDPKHKQTLPYYDTFPLSIMVSRAKDGFYGLNLHYLSPKVRARFLDELLLTLNNDRYDDSTKMKINYNLLKSVNKYREFKPCFKHYLTKHVDSKIVMVQPPEWEIAIFLPTERFNKKNKTHVWGESKMIFSS